MYHLELPTGSFAFIINLRSTYGKPQLIIWSDYYVISRPQSWSTLSLTSCNEILHGVNDWSSAEIYCAVSEYNRFVCQMYLVKVYVTTHCVWGLSALLAVS